MLNHVASGIIIGLLFVTLIVSFCALIIKLYIRKAQAARERELFFQKTLNAAIIETQEELLNTISGELHDNAGQQLTYINFLLENTKLSRPELSETLDTLSAPLRSLAVTIRNISHSLHNQPVTQQDLARALEAEVARLQRLGTIKFTFSKSGETLKYFSSNEKIMLYRIFQEVINNSLKHSGATEIGVILEAAPVFTLTVTDNGKGFVYPDADGNNGLGLNNIFSRAEIIKFGVEVASAPGKGTKVRLYDNSHQL